MVCCFYSRDRTLVGRDVQSSEKTGHGTGAESELVQASKQARHTTWLSDLTLGIRYLSAFDRLVSDWLIRRMQAAGVVDRGDGTHLDLLGSDGTCGGCINTLLGFLPIPFPRVYIQRGPGKARGRGKGIDHIYTRERERVLRFTQFSSTTHISHICLVVIVHITHLQAEERE